MSNTRDKFQWVGANYYSSYKGKDWSDPKNKAWVNFPWNEVDGEEKKYIKSLWTAHSTNVVNEAIWPYQAMLEKGVSRTVTVGTQTVSFEHPQSEGIVKDTGKFLFYDAINLAPTLGEYRGYHLTELESYSNNGNRFFQYYKTPGLIQIKEKDKFVKKQIYNGNISMSEKEQFFDKNGNGDAGLLRSVRTNKTNYYTSIINNTDIEWDKMYHPSEEEFKLSWMRELLEYGIEARMGPFAWKGQKVDGKNVPLLTSRDTHQINIGDLSDLFKSSGVPKLDMGDYQYSLLYNWAKNELDWAEGKHNKSFGINEHFPNYLENQFPKASIDSLSSLVNRRDSSRIDSFTKGDIPLKYSGYFNQVGNTPIPKNTDIQPIKISIGNSGLERTNAKSLDDWTSTTNDFIKPPRGLGGDGKPIPIYGIGIPPHFKDETDKKNYIVSGWVTIPKIFGDIKLPWPFVWKYIGRTGFYPINGDIDLLDTFCKSNPNMPGVSDMYSSSFNENYWRYNYRLRLWWYRYTSKKIPNRELLFYIRMKYGISKAVGLRYVASKSSTIVSIFRKIWSSAVVSAGLKYIRGGIYSVVKHMEFLKNDPDKKRISDSLICGGLPNDPNILKEYPTYDTFGNVDNPPQPLEKDDNGSLYSLRSMYVSAVQDLSAWKRFKPGSSELQQPTKESLHKIVGKEEEIVDYNQQTGFYTFNGHGSDRLPFSENEKYQTYKSWMASDIKSNDITLSSLFDVNTTKTGSFKDPNDSYSSPEQLQSYNWSCIDGGCTDKNPQVEEKDRIYYHNHHVNPEFSVKNELHPAIFSPKELQFIYESISYCLYGNTYTTDGSVVSPVIWSVNKPSFRWEEMLWRVNVAYDKNEWNINRQSTATIEFRNVKKSSTVTLADYILWAAPTYDQYSKTKFSSREDTFLKRISDKNAPQSVINNENIIIYDSYGGVDNKSLRSSYPDIYPFDNIEKHILRSEQNSSVRPLVPALIHHRFLSRKMNNAELYFKDGNDARGINFFPLNYTEETNINIVRALGGKINNDPNVPDKGILLLLPTFVLGGRVDLGESPDTWDRNWGPNPFFLKDGKLIIRNFDKVIDSWAQGKLHNGKYVSAMEIMFWIRFRHGLAASPNTTRTPIQKTDGSYQWPKFLNGMLESTISKDRGHFGLYPHETFNNIQMVTSYYNPIIVDQYSYLCHDPLIELNTSPPNIAEDDIVGQKNAFTGFNSYYACNWEGANPVKELRNSNWVSLKDYDGLFRPSMSYPSTTAMKTTHTNHYLMIHKEYREIENGKFGYKSNKYISVTGFDYHPNIEDCSKIILASDVQSWFRSYKIITEMDLFSEYIERGLKLPEGAEHSVLEVEGSEKGKDGKPSESTVSFFISGEGIGSRQNSFRKTTPLTFSERIRMRPWFDRMEVAQGTTQVQAENLCDDFYYGSRGCIPQYRYMRHILIPQVFMWLSDTFELKKENGGGGYYTPQQSDKTRSSVYKTVMFWSKMGYSDGIYFGLGNNEIIKESRSLSYDERLSGLGLQHLMLSSISSKWRLDSNYEKDPRKMSRINQFFNYYIVTNRQKFIWNTAVAKFASTLLSGIASVKLYDGAKVIKDWKFDEVLDQNTIQILKQSQEALDKQNVVITQTIKASSKIKKILFDKYGIFKYSKYLFDIINAGWLGYQKPSGAQTSDDELNKVYGYAKPIIAFGQEYIFAKVQSYAINKVTHQILESAVVRASQAATRAAFTETVVATGAQVGVRTGGKVGGAVLIITSIVAVVSYSVDRFREIWELNEQYEEIWKKLYFATENNYLEGPYLQSDGTILIKKTETGAIPILGRTYNSKENSSSNTIQPSSVQYKKLDLEKMTSEEIQKFIKQENDNFYDSNGKLDSILKEIEPDSCECKFFNSIFESPTNVDIKNLQNWNKGHYKRRLKNRQNVIDEAPIFSDIPIVYEITPGPRGTVSWWPTFAHSYDAQIGEIQRGPNTSNENIREAGSNGTRATYSTSCPRFWWPSTLIHASANLCEYMALDGKYPKKTPEYYAQCNHSDHQNASNRNISKIYDNILMERSQIPFTDVKPEDLKDYVNAKYSRNKISSLQNIEYKQYSSTFDFYVPNKISPYTLPGSSFTRRSSWLYSKKQDDNVYLGNYVFTTDGVNGPAPPHEREIINIFRKKYKIDLVIPKYWMDNNNRSSGIIHNPYKNKIPNTYSMWPSNCCGMSEVVNAGLDSDGEQQTPTFEQRQANLNKKKFATYCEYVIALNTETFKTKIQNKCAGRITENQDNTQKTLQSLTETTPVPQNPDPEPEDLAEKPIIPDCIGCSEDPKDDPFPKPPNPLLPECTNCPSDRPLVTEIRRRIPQVIVAPSRFRNSLILGSSSVYFNNITINMWSEETISTPLEPGERKWYYSFSKGLNQLFTTDRRVLKGPDSVPIKDEVPSNWNDWIAGL